MTPLCFATLLVLSAGAPPDASATAAPAPSAPATPAASSGATAVPAAAAEPASPAAAPAVMAPIPAVAPAGGSGAPPGPYNAPAEGPDVELHVPKAEVQKLSLDVENLQARLDVDTSVAQLVTIRAGVIATVQKLKAELDGVQAETHLVVRLNRVAEIMNRALAAIEDKPQLAGGAPASAAAHIGATVPAAGAGVSADASVVPAPAAATPNSTPAPTKPPTE